MLCNMVIPPSTIIINIRVKLICHHATKRKSINATPGTLIIAIKLHANIQHNMVPVHKYHNYIRVMSTFSPTHAQTTSIYLLLGDTT